MSLDWVARQIENARRTVESWPKWKQEAMAQRAPSVRPDGEPDPSEPDMEEIT